ncbi:MAG TPA: TIGR00730 family Rossman fold protein [Dehalococcoidia bacterium]|nr:TIGR00730 family Rossman fold protein [Dehalococcoidia bacterium]
MQRICVFCGSSSGFSPRYVDAARRLGEDLARAKITLVFGGGGGGLMGTMADSVLGAGGKVIGVIPEQLVARELGHQRLTELRVVGSMHERKALMAELSDAFIALPGGAGTLEEFCEIWTWAQLRIHTKPCGVLNVDGYYDTFLAFLDETVEKGFLRAEYRALILVEHKAEVLLERLRTYRTPDLPDLAGRLGT